MKNNKSVVSCKRGFTLIELLVVVLIIGILAAVAVPQYKKAVERAETRQALVLLKALAQAETAFYMENGTYTDDFSKLDIDIPFTGTTKWINETKFKAKSLPKWSVMLENSSEAVSILIGRLGGLYDKRVGFGYYFKYFNPSVPKNKILCMELNSIYNQGSYCQKIVGGQLVFTSGVGTRLYEINN